MSKIKVAVATTDAPLPVGSAAFAVILLAVVDAAGASQSARLNGQEPEPFTTQFEVADGAGTVSAVALDANDVPIPGSEITQGYSVGVPVAAPPVDAAPALAEAPPEVAQTFKQPVGLVVTAVDG